MSEWIKTLDKYRGQRYSQCWEDGIINRIFESIGTTNTFFVDIGAGDGKYNSNTANLRIHAGWHGLLLDKKPGGPIVQKEFITAENVNDVLKKHNVPDEFDLLSIDVDGNDYWVWKALNYHPRVVVIEFNPNHLDSRTIKYDPNFEWDKTNYYGASLLALKYLGGEKGYSLIYQADFLNAFFIRKDIVDVDIPFNTILSTTFKAHLPDDKKRRWVLVGLEENKNI